MPNDARPMSLSPQLTKLFLNLRLAAVAIFPMGVVLIAILQRSVLMVAALAIGMMISNRIEQWRLRGALNMLGDKAVPYRLQLGGLLPGFAMRLGLMAGLFIILIGVMALFRDTSLARGFGWIDLWLFAGITGFAVLANEISARMVETRADDAVRTLRSAMAPSPGSAGAGGDIIDGEVVDAETTSKPD